MGRTTRYRKSHPRSISQHDSRPPSAAGTLPRTPRSLLPAPKPTKHRQSLSHPTTSSSSVRFSPFFSPSPNVYVLTNLTRGIPRIFFPTHHDLTFPTLLQTLFAIHGGTFTLGTPQDDDIWDRAFSDAHTILVIALNYSKSPWVSFPVPLKDLGAIYHAALGDDSLAIDRMRTAILGFDAGANLALGLSQLPNVKSGIDPSANSTTAERYPYFHQMQQRARCNSPPAAVISVCGILDFSVSPAEKLRARPYKKEFLKGPRG